MNFNRLPFNTQRAYVCGIDKSGTEIWVPTFCNDKDIMQKKKEELQEFLDNQPAPSDVG